MVEIGREVVNADAKTDPSILPGEAYDLPALLGTSIVLRGSSKSAGTLGSFLKIHKPGNHD